MATKKSPVAAMRDRCFETELKTLSTFLTAAMDAGLAARLGAMRTDVERAIADYPPGDTRHLVRLQGQLQRLQNPGLDLVVRLVGVLCEQYPSRVAVIAPLARDLQARFPALASLPPAPRP